jgi:hypothetical protein
MTARPLRINGLIINLLSSRGLSVDSAVKLLNEVRRIQPQIQYENVYSKYKSLKNRRSLQSNDPEFHTAQRRIQTLEKVIKQMANGHSCGLKRKKWRQNGDSKYILETLSHILSRTEPKEQSDVLKDRQTLLERTVEWCPEDLMVKYTPKYSDLIPVKIEDKNNILNLAEYSDDDLNIISEKSIRSKATMQIMLRLKNTFPISVEKAIQETIAKALPNFELDIFSKEIEASNFIDWQAFTGPMKSWLIHINQQQSNPNGYSCSLAIQIEYYEDTQKCRHCGEQLHKKIRV